MKRGIITRKAWHGVKHAWFRLTGFKDVYIHHTAGGFPRTYAAEKAELQSVDRQHHGQGWSGIGYNFAVAVSGRKWTGRGWKSVGAHNDDENSFTYGIVVMGNFVRPPGQDTYTKAELGQVEDAIVDVIKRGQNRETTPKIRKRPRVRPHSASDATACPGDHLRARIPSIRRRVNGTA